MNLHKPTIGRRLIAANLLTALLLSGCWHAKVSVPLPMPNPPAQLGSTVNPMLEAQEMQGEANDFVIYQHEFVTNTADLNPHGVSHVQQIAARANSVPFPIIVETSDASPATGQPVQLECYTIDQLRRQRIVAALTTMGVASASQRVVVGPPLASGLTSGQAEQVYSTSFGQRGGGGGGNATGGGFGGGGFGAGF